jgi:hypothetical protein
MLRPCSEPKATISGRTWVKGIKLSSILKALKKLENEQPRQEQVQSLSGSVHTYRQKTHDARRFRILVSKISVAGLAIAVLAGGGFIGFDYVSKKKSPPLETSTIDSGDINKVAMTSKSTTVSLAEKKKQPGENTGTTLKRTAKDNPPTPGAPSTVNSPVVFHLPDQEPVIQTAPGPVETPLLATSRTPAPDKGLVTDEQGAVDRAPFPEPQDREQPVEENIRASVASPVGEITYEDEPDADDAHRQIPIFTGEGELKLMAIAWSDDPSSRMAVINGGVVREGGAAGDAHIEKINADEVIIRKNNTLYRLVFKLK